MRFRTEIDIAPSATPIDYSTKILSLGSCFALSIGEKLRESKFDICVNPVGVLFNPLSICSTLQRFETCRMVGLSELQSRGSEWFHFDFHSSLSGISPQEALEKMNNAVREGHMALKACDTIIITLGTTGVYHLGQSGDVVANCHKEPSKHFERRTLSVEQIVESLGAEVAKYPSKQFIFSVSPIRHLLDGLSESSLSKATLRVAISQIVERYANASYFPAYEIMLDDLRDYRFYADDMLHPSTQAVEYIFSKFREVQISPAAYPTMDSVAAIVRAAAHRPFNVASDAHQEFCRQQIERIKRLPDLDFGKENEYFISQLQNNL